jgi:competence protein ComEC
VKNQFEASFSLAVVVLLALLGLLALTWVSLPDSRLHLHFLEVGQGDSIMIQTPSKYNILIDGGPNRNVLAQVGKVLPFWDKKIDLLVATNPDKDHIQGLNSILNTYQVDEIWLPRVKNDTTSYTDLLANIEKKQVRSTAPRTGDRISLQDGVEIQVLWPKTQEPQVTSINEGSVVLLVKYGDFSALMTGDAERTTQPYPDLQEEVEVLKVPHHGSKEGMNEEYLEILSPELSVIQVGAKNPYGLPASETVKELEGVGSRVLKTSDSGAVEVVSDGKTWYTRTER